MAIKVSLTKTAQLEKDYRDFIKDTDEVKLHTECITLYPELWKRYAKNYGLKWKVAKFDEVSKPTIPKEKGIYAFVVVPDLGDLPPSSWLFYIGEVGATNSQNRHFNKRYSEYIDEFRIATRPKLAMLFNRYKGHIYFYYCAIDPNNNMDIKDIESELITAAWPFANIKDFAVRMRKSRRAFS